MDTPSNTKQFGAPQVGTSSVVPWDMPTNPNQPRCISCRRFVRRGVMRCVKCDMTALAVLATPVPTRGVTRYNHKPAAPAKRWYATDHLATPDSAHYATVRRVTLVSLLVLLCSLIACVEVL